MSKYIVVKEKEKLNTPYLEENKKKEKLQPESIEYLKEKTILPSQTIETTKSKLSFSPLIVKEEKTTKTIPSIVSSEEKNSIKLTYSSNSNYKKGNFSLETIISKEKKSSPTFTPLKIENQSKKNEDLNIPVIITSKAKGFDMLQNEPIFSKSKEPLSADITEKKEKEELSHEYELIQKDGKKLRGQITENKNDARFGELPETINKKDVDLEEVSAEEKETIDLNTKINATGKNDAELEQLILQNRELFGIEGEISKEDKDKLNLLIPEIENLATNGKIDPNKRIEEKKTGKWWDKAKDWLEELLGFNLEIATLKSLLMPPELDKLLSDIKSFKGAVTHGDVIDATIGGFNLTNELYDKMSHFTFGELAGVYASNFFTLTGFRPSPSIKNPGKKQIGDDEWSGGILLNSENPFGSIEDESNTTLRKLGRFTDLKGLKNFGINQIGNLFTGRNRKKEEDDDGELVYNKTTSKWEFKYNKDRWKLRNGNIAGDLAKANNAFEEPDAVQALMGSLEYDEAGDGWAEEVFDPAIRLGNSALNGNIEKELKNQATNKSSNFINKIFDVGNAKANTIKEKYKVEISDDGKIDKQIKALGIGKGKISDLISKKEDLINQLGFNKKKENTTGYGYEIAETNAPEDTPHINILNDMEYSNENLNTLKKSIEENYLSIQNKNNYNLGYMIVEPACYNNEFENFKIDFQFNPEITEGSLKARYDTATILNRIGQLETYVGTDSITAQIKLQYRVLSRDPNKGRSWMSRWTLNYIQQIEMALRALTVPASSGNRTTRPPVVRIEMGDKSNLFKFPILTNQSQKWRYFIATDVTINKFYEGSSYYIDDSLNRDFYNGYKNQAYNLYARDMMGFDADISLTEVKKSYFTYYPNFNDYYDSVVNGPNSNKDTLPNFLISKGVS